MASGSLLEKVAQHEIALMAELDTAEAQAQTIIDAAYTAASAHLQAVQARMDAEIIEMRRKAADERIAIREGIENASRKRVKEIRDKSASKLESVKSELLNLVLPKKGGTA